MLSPHIIEQEFNSIGTIKKSIKDVFTNMNAIHPIAITFGAIFSGNPIELHVCTQPEMIQYRTPIVGTMWDRLDLN